MTAHLDIAELTAPLPDGTGPDLRAGGEGSAVYFALKDFRAEARRAERKASESGEQDADPLRAGMKAWEEIATGGVTLLATRSKDLEVAAWLSEAWLRTDGIGGLAAGIELMAGLIETFWSEGLHPGEDEDGAETRIAPLIGLFGRGEAGTLLQPIKLLPLSDQGVPPPALWSVEVLRAQSTRHDDPEERDRLVERRNERIGLLEQSIARASSDFVATAKSGFARALAALERLMIAVDTHTSLGRFGSQVARPLEDALTLLRSHHPDTIEGVEDIVTEDIPMSEGGDTAPPVQAGRLSRPTAVGDRETALATLLEVAAFFDRNEPQSLVGQSVRDVVRRANLPLDALLAELIPESDQRTMFLLRAGIRTARHDDFSTS